MKEGYVNAIANFISEFEIIVLPLLEISHYN